MGNSMTSLAGLHVTKRASNSKSFSHLEVRIGHRDVTGHTTAMGKITVNEPCFQIGEGNGHVVGIFFCKQLMEGRYIAVQALKDIIALDELNVIVRSDT